MTPQISVTSFGSARRALSAGGDGHTFNCSQPSSRSRMRVGPVICALGMAAVVTAASALAASRLTRNYTPSLPLGIYWIRPDLLVVRGEIVDFAIPRSARELIAGRYLPARFHLLKRVVALEGDVVCFSDGHYRVNGVAISRIARGDSLGRPLPMFDFCGRVASGTAFVATSVSSSLDSRYFGPVPVSTLTVARPLWTS
jgi:conjugative transfer signal peptidase TraF